MTKAKVNLFLRFSKYYGFTNWIIFSGARVGILQTEIKDELGLCLDDKSTLGAKHNQHIADKFGIRPQVVKTIKTFKQLHELLMQRDETISKLLEVFNDQFCLDARNRLSSWLINTYPNGFAAEAQTERQTQPVQVEPSLAIEEDGTVTPVMESQIW